MAILDDDVDLDRDRTLVARFQAGDTEAFDDLYVRYFARLARFCRKRVENSFEAEEVAQEAFARAYRALPRLGGDQRFYPWLTVIASRVAIDTHRRNARAARVPVTIDLSVEGGQEIVLHQADVADLRTAMERLRPRYRDVLELREGRGWSYRKIAEHYGVTVGTVQLLIFRSRAALRREFHAVAGTESRLAGLAGLGAVFSRFVRGAQRAHARAGLAADGGLGLVLQPVAALLLIVGAITALQGGAPAPAAPAPVTVRPAALDRTVADPSAAPSSDAVRSIQAQPAAGTTPSLPRGLTTPSSAEGREWQRGAPVRAGAGGVSAGANPAAVLGDSARAAERYLSQLGVQR